MTSMNESCALSTACNSFEWLTSWETNNDRELVAAEMKQFIDDKRQRHDVEGTIGECKRRYGLALIREKLIAIRAS